jgi:hypothetical protein
MPTTFATTTLVLLVTTNGIGQLAAVDKKDLPSPYTNAMVVNLESCNYMRGKMEHPEKYFCQVFTSPKTTTWTYVPPGEITPAEASPPPPEIRPQADPTSAPGKLEPPPKEKETAASVPKKLAQRPRYERQAMFEGNPFSGLFNW